MITHRLIPSLSAFLVITALSCSDEDLTQPVSDPPEEGFEIVVAGRILTWEGSPPDEVRLQVVIRQGSGGLHTGALVDEDGRFSCSQQNPHRCSRCMTGS